MPSVEINGQGGLGNQIFQALAASRVSKISGVTTRFNISKVATHHNSGFDITSLNLDGLNVVIESTKSKSRRIEERILYSDFSAVAENLFGIKHLRHEHGETEAFFESFRSTLESKHSLRKIILDGYFADFSICFNSEAQSLLIGIEINDTRILKMWELFGSSPYSFVHVRLGDYLSNPGSPGVLSKEYFTRALNLLREIHPDWPLVIASNQTVLVGDFIPRKFLSHAFLLPDSRDIDPVNILLIMSRASAGVLANSTFSYWGGYLGKAQKTVIYPKYASSGVEYVFNTPKDWVPIEPDWLSA